MKSADFLRRLLAAARWRRVAIECALWLPGCLLLVYLAYRFVAMPITLALGMLLAMLLARRLLQQWQRLDRAWLIQALDHADRRLQDSSDLLFAAEDDLGVLQQLQKQRVQQWLQAQAHIDLRENIPWSRLRLLWLLALLLGALPTLWQHWLPMHDNDQLSEPAIAGQAPARQALNAQLRVLSPAYTELPEQQIDSLEAEVAEGSVLHWSLRFAIEPRAVTLRFVGGDSLTLVEKGGIWQGQRAFTSSSLYRLELDAAALLPERAPYRIEVRPDRAPQIDVTEPQRTLTLLDAGARQVHLRFEASDDYALGDAELQLTLAQGSGEQVTVSERRRRLRGSGDRLHQQFDHRIDLASLGFSLGDDLILRVQVSDRREPKPNLSRSASFILRWPAPLGSEGSGVEGLVQQTLPAYFRSQRQIIIDSEALIAEQADLTADQALQRSDAIGFDQRILRLRYGQFLGEEAEDDAAAGHEHEGEDEPAFGNADEVRAAAGHGHDIAEAATLLDPATRRLLRAALGEMWQAELHLRSGEPRQALPFEYRALDHIKQIQQASRIYLARVGLELPQLDMTRRLSGEAPSASRRSDPLSAESLVDPLMQTWQSLQAEQPLPLDALLAWIEANPERVSDRLAMLSEIDALQRDASCGECRRRLQGLLWPLLPPPTAAPQSRMRSDAIGKAYLDALQTTGRSP